MSGAAAAKGALREAAAWRLLSLLFERPRAETRAEIASIAAEVEDPALRGAAGAAAEASEGLYLALLGPGGPVSPREVAYRPLEDPGRILSDLTAAYEAFAYRPRSEDPIDHVAVEAGFAGYLMIKVSYAVAAGRREEADVAREARAAFLRDHLAPLARGVAERLAGSGIYLERAAAALAARAATETAGTRGAAEHEASP